MDASASADAAHAPLSGTTRSCWPQIMLAPAGECRSATAGPLMIGGRPKGGTTVQARKTPPFCAKRYDGASPPTLRMRLGHRGACLRLREHACSPAIVTWDGCDLKRHIVHLPCRRACNWLDRSSKIVAHRIRFGTRLEGQSRRDQSTWEVEYIVDHSLHTGRQ